MKRVPEYDGLRGIAVTAVILFHAKPTLVAGGFVGVDLFFVLSAFLISSNLAAGQPLLTFYRNRLLRLYPALLLLLAVYVIAAPLLWSGNHWRDAALAGLYLTDFTYPPQPFFLQHTWSLAIEEQFYLVWPIALFALIKARQPLIWLGLALAAMMAWRMSFHDWQRVYYRPDTHSTGLIVGAMLFFSGIRLGRWANYVGLAMFVGLCLVADIRFSGWITAAEIAAFLLVASAPNTNWLAAKPLVHLGKLSYAMYLWHFPIALVYRGYLPFAQSAALTFVASYAMALFSYHTVEAWGRKRRMAGQAKADEADLIDTQALNTSQRRSLISRHQTPLERPQTPARYIRAALRRRFPS